jgi:hypothetical protein
MADGISSRGAGNLSPIPSSEKGSRRDRQGRAAVCRAIAADARGACEQQLGGEAGRI